ncbi:ROK family transcriptional regulator [Candidatus Puniceispirillum marinum]|jgi:predicted NBD/HSP70 family sugar kinase|uniref:Transcriptional regulator, ROK family n=1 Tax=Puniceispirillum marinum (strain IMCC1322) TaxID=488538 RepID=D5BU09_PUNMI|nr:ROK family transcriptional regulator [Candidatus Puniceispirillum marinum]ADE39756.1 transcriptional regulator, ROK family [Candidatus Puniceispirillum marinum IMCC1322]
MAARRLGGSQLGIGDYNEKVVLYHVRHQKQVTKAEIARSSGLAAQTVSVIVNRLLKAGLLKSSSAKKTERKQVGFPAKPVILNPQAVFSIGISIGRRSLSISLVNFCCEIVKQFSATFEYPNPMFCLDFIESHFQKMVSSLTMTERDSLIGVGVSAPYGLGDRMRQTQGKDILTDNWKKINLKTFIEGLTDLPVFLEHDVKAACLADMTLTPKNERAPSYLYIFVGTVLGGAIVIEDNLFKGRFGYAGALGPMITGRSEDGKPLPVLDFASTSMIDKPLARLGTKLIAESLNNGTADSWGSDDKSNLAEIERWLETASRHLALLIINSCSILDFETIVIDGDLPKAIVEELCHRTEQELEQIDFTGLIRPNVSSGKLGHDSYALGASFLPIYARFEPTQAQFFSQTNDVNKII